MACSLASQHEPFREVPSQSFSTAEEMTSEEVDQAVIRWLNDSGERHSPFRKEFLLTQIKKKKIACCISEGEDLWKIAFFVKDWLDAYKEWDECRGRNSHPDSNVLKKAFLTSFKSLIRKKPNVTSYSSGCRTVVMTVTQEDLRKEKNSCLKALLCVASVGEKAFEKRIEDLISEQDNIKRTLRKRVREAEPPSQECPQQMRFFGEPGALPEFHGVDPQEACVGSWVTFKIEANILFREIECKVELVGDDGTEGTFFVSCVNNRLCFKALWTVPETVKATLHYGNFSSPLNHIVFKLPQDSSEDDVSQTRTSISFPAPSSPLLADSCCADLSIKDLERLEDLFAVLSAEGDCRTNAYIYQKFLDRALPRLLCSKERDINRLFSITKNCGIDLIQKLRREDPDDCRIFSNWCSAFRRRFVNQPLSASNSVAVEEAKIDSPHKRMLLEESKIAMQPKDLWTACKNGCLEDVKALIYAGADVIDTEWPLWAACFKGHTEIVKYLITETAAEPYVNKTDKALVAACENGHVDVAKLLINAGACETGEYGTVSLLAACENGHTDVAKLLINCGVDVNETGECGTAPLAAACENGHTDVAELLIIAGANVNKTGKCGTALFMGACENRHTEVAKRLLAGADVEICVNEDVAELPIKAGADFNKTGEYGTALFLAACEGTNTDILKFLISRGMDVNEIGECVTSPLWVACRNGSTDVAELLLNAGADVNECGTFPSPVACRNADLYLTERLIQTSIKNRRTSLWDSCEKGEIAIARLLHESGANFSRKDEYGHDALWAACANERLEMANLLIEYGADVNTSDQYGRPILLEVCENGSQFIAELLIRAGADVNKADNFGRTPLLAACESGNVEQVKFLFAAGADVNRTTKRGCRNYSILAGRRLCLSARENCSMKNDKLVRTSQFGGTMAAFQPGDLTTDDLTKMPLLAACEYGLDKVRIEKKAGVNRTTRHYTGKLIQEFLCQQLILTNYLTVVNRTDEFEWTPFHIACQSGSLKLVKLLIDVGVDLNRKDEKGNSCLHRIAEQSCKHHGFSSVDLAKCVLSENPSLIDSVGQDNLRPFEVHCSAKMKRFLYDFWIKHRYHCLYSQGTRKPKKIQICVFGANKCGKTSLIKTLRNHYWCGNLEGNLACDFSEQPFMHKGFLSNSSGFLFVVDTTQNYDDLKQTSHYFCSFYKSSVVFNQRAYIVVAGSKIDLLNCLDVGRTKLQQLIEYLRNTFGDWFNFYQDPFVLDCRRESKALECLRNAIEEVTALIVEAVEEIPAIVEAATTSFLPSLRLSFDPHSLFLKNHDQILIFEKDMYNSIGVMRKLVFSQMFLSVYNTFPRSSLNLLIEFLEEIGEITVFEDRTIFFPHWLHQNVIAPILAAFKCSPLGKATKESIQSLLKNLHCGELVNDVISILLAMELCYPLPSERDTYQIPSLLQQSRPFGAWCENSECKVYVGRRLKLEEETDMITPGTMPLLQCRICKSAFRRGIEPIVWKGGLVTKALDFVVRGPKNSERECMEVLAEIKSTGESVLREKCPGTNRSLWYISNTDLKQLKDFPRAYREETVDQVTKSSRKTSALVSQGTIKDSLKDLLALPNNHIDFLSYQTHCVLQACLQNDEEGRKALAKRLPDLTFSDMLESDSTSLLATWSKNISATVQCLADAARQSKLLYILHLLHCELSSEEKRQAERELKFVLTNSPYEGVDLASLLLHL